MVWGTMAALAMAGQIISLWSNTSTWAGNERASAADGSLPLLFGTCNRLHHATCTFQADWTCPKQHFAYLCTI